MFGVYEDLVFSVDKTGSCGVISGLAELNCRHGAIRGALWCVRPRKRLAAASLRARRARRERVSTRTAIVMQWPHFRR